MKIKQIISEIGNMDLDPRLVASLKFAVDNNQPMLLIGETGVGKTSVVQEYAKSLKKNIVRLNLNGQTGTDEILGRWILKGKETIWQDGILIQAMKEGSWIILDEINAALPEVTFALHQLLDHDRSITLVENDSARITAHDDFRIFCTMNPNYAGTKDLNLAFKSRFPIVEIMTYSKNEKDILIKRENITPEDAEKLVLLANEMRIMYQNHAVSYPCSTRDLLYAAKLLKGFKFTEAITMAIINKVDPSEVPALIKTIETLLGDKFKIADQSFDTLSEIKDTYLKFKEDAKQVKERNKELEEQAKQAHEAQRKAEEENEKTQAKMNLLQGEIKAEVIKALTEKAEAEKTKK